MLGVVSVAMFIAFLPLMLVAAVVLAAIAAFGLFVYAMVQVRAYLVSLGSSASEAASSIISGLIGGITSGAGALYSAMTGLASGAMTAFKTAIGYGSPAKAFIAYGQIGIAGGVEKGVDQGAASVNSAIDGMVSIPGSQTGASKVSGGGAKVTVQLNYQGKDRAEETATRGLLAQFCDAVEQGCKSAGIPLELETV
jgi:phage-related protein